MDNPCYEDDKLRLREFSAPFPVLTIDQSFLRSPFASPRPTIRIKKADGKVRYPPSYPLLGAERKKKKKSRDEYLE